MKAALLAGGAFVLAFVAAWVFPLLLQDTRPKCEAEAVATVKVLVLRKLEDYDVARALLGNAIGKGGQTVVDIRRTANYSLSAFRDRAPYGTKGTSCAAQIDLFAGQRD